MKPHRLTVADNKLNELAELLRELEQTLLTLKAMKDPEPRRLLIRKMSRLFAEIDRVGPTDANLHTFRAFVVQWSR